MEISESELREWSRRNYPDFAGNIELMKVCWQRDRGLSSSLKADAEEVHINELKKFERKDVILKVLIAREIDEKFYYGCPVCKKKGCDGCGGEMVKYIWKGYIVGDSSGICILKTLIMEGDESPVKVGGDYVIRVRVNNKFNGRYEVMFKNFEKNPEVKKEVEVPENKPEMKSEKKSEFEGLSKDMIVAILSTREILEIWDKKLEVSTFERWFKRQEFGPDATIEKVMAEVGVMKEDGFIVYKEKKEGE